MKKTILTIFSFVFILQFVFGGGIVTNTNQSAAWVRSMVRDASVDVDAVFFNPAGLTHLEDGFYIQVNSQTVMQGRTVTSTYPGLNNDTYEGETFVPVLPTGFLAYKKGNLAISAGFTIIGGGGSAEFPNGLPSFEYSMIDIPAAFDALAPIGQQAGVDLSVSGYSADVFFKGSSAYYGIQAGVSYKINDVLSVGIGGRYILANNSYEGYIRDISTTYAGNSMRVDDYINNVAVPTIGGVQSELEGQLAQVTQINDAMNTFIGLGMGGLTIQQILDSGQIPPEQVALIAGTLGAFGIDPSLVTLQQLSDLGLIQGAMTELNTNIATLDGTTTFLGATAAALGDQEVDVTQSGTGFTPIISVDLNFMEGDLGLALKYEHKTTMTVKTDVVQDDPGLYNDGEEVTSDMPGMISVGLRYRPVDAFRIQTGFHYYLDMDASYGKKADGAAINEFVKNGEEALIGGETTTYLAGNSYEAALGLEYDVHKMATLSAGFLYTASDPNDDYQTGLSYTLNTMTFGVGASLHLIENFDLDLGYSNTTYTAYTRDFGTFEESYDKTASVFAAGITYKF